MTLTDRCRCLATTSTSAPTAQLLGAIRIGDGAKIGAMAVVLCDVPAGATAVGAPARVILATPSAPPVRLVGKSHNNAAMEGLAS